MSKFAWVSPDSEQFLQDQANKFCRRSERDEFSITDFKGGWIYNAFG